MCNGRRLITHKTNFRVSVHGNNHTANQLTNSNKLFDHIHEDQTGQSVREISSWEQYASSVKAVRQ